MKRSLFILLLCFSCLLCSCSKSNGETDLAMLNWEDYFTCTSQYFEADSYNGDPVDYMLNAKPARYEFIFTNKSTNALKNVYVFFLVVPQNGEAFEYFYRTQSEKELFKLHDGEYLGNLKPKEQKTATIRDWEIEDALSERNQNKSQNFIVKVSRIEFELE